jgi:hypothetical protein
MMSRIWKISAVVILAVAILAPGASARPRIFIGGYFGPVYYGPGFYGWYAPAWYWPYGPYVYAPASNMGAVKIDTNRKDAQVYVDGAYAGTVAQLKTFPLGAGEHDIELRSPNGQSFYQERVTIVPGRTLTLNP